MFKVLQNIFLVWEHATWRQFISSAREVMAFRGIGLFSVCLQNNLKSYGRILIRLSGSVDNDTRNSLLDDSILVFS